jgi:hypothetical protein
MLPVIPYRYESWHSSALSVIETGVALRLEFRDFWE